MKGIRVKRNLGPGNKTPSRMNRQIKKQFSCPGELSPTLKIRNLIIAGNGISEFVLHEPNQL